MTSKLSVILPIAAGGDVERFRPFDLVAGEAIVHRAVRSFLPFRERIDRFVFVYTAAEETRFDVRRTLGEVCTDLPFETVILDRQTAGPAETIARGVEAAGLAGVAIVCDIDHRLDVAPLLAAGAAEPAGTTVCVWPLGGEDLKRWSVACVGEDGCIRTVRDRALPEGSGDFLGVIGCYLFADIAAVARACIADGHARFSSYFNALAGAGDPPRTVKLQTAEFFGDLQRIREIERGSRFIGTIFCDIDGTIFEHEDVPSYAALPRVLPGSRDKLLRWVEEGYCVVLCTARSDTDEEQLTQALHSLGIVFHRLICGLPSGPRMLINDRKPSLMFTTQARSFEIHRNQGIQTLELPSRAHPSVLRRFEGGSFAETLLLEAEGKRFVRKLASKHANLALGYSRLRAQYRTVERFEQMCPGLTPRLLGEEDNSHEYFYDMEYLDGFKQLNHLPSERRADALGALLDRLNRYVYSHQSAYPGLGDEWFETHLRQKIFAKMDDMAANERLRPLVMGPGTEINGIFTPSLEAQLLDVVSPHLRRYFAPAFLSIVHGDLTFQNVMVSDDDVKVIDMEFGGTPDGVELDFGKLLQSIVSRYDDWHLSAAPLTRAEHGGAVELLYRPDPLDEAMMASVLERWAALLKCSRDMVRMKGSFYLALHLVRMVPFRLRESTDQAVYALATALQHMREALTMAKSL